MFNGSVNRTYNIGPFGRSNNQIVKIQFFIYITLGSIKNVSPCTGSFNRPEISDRFS